MQLREIAFARSGDKGNTSNIAVFARREEDYAWLERWLTSERVHGFFASVMTGEVTRYPLPNLQAINFVLTGALGGGVTRSLNLDAHGKCMAAALLGMEIPEQRPL